MHHPTDRIAHTTAFVTPVVWHWLEREIAQWVHPMKDRSDSMVMCLTPKETTLRCEVNNLHTIIPAFVQDNVEA